MSWFTITVVCCKCHRATRKFKCPKCDHKICTSCKPKAQS